MLSPGVGEALHEQPSSRRGTAQQLSWLCLAPSEASRKPDVAPSPWALSSGPHKPQQGWPWLRPSAADQVADQLCCLSVQGL